MSASGSTRPSRPGPVREGAITIKGKGGLVRTVPLHPLLVSRLELHLQTTPRGHKLFVPDDMETHTAIQHLQAFIRTYRPYIQDAGSARHMTFHGLRHVCAASGIRSGSLPAPRPTRPARRSPGSWDTGGMM